MKEAGAGLLARQEYRSHLHGLCAKSRAAITPRESAMHRGNHWHIDTLAI